MYATQFRSRVSVPLPMPVNGPAAVMVGAGFSRAVNPNTVVWRGLIEDVRRTLNLDGTLPSDADLMVEAYRISRRFSSDRRTALPTRFQRAVLDVLKPRSVRHSTDASVAANKQAIANSFRELLDALRCRIIIDLNYDDSVEEVLTAAGCRYVRWIGSEASWSGPPPLDSIRLWKIHGSIDQPATIVLSPTEYQRLYEVNEIGDALGALGKHIGAVWTVGVGLQEDDIWLHLCRSSRPFDIVALWMTSATTDDSIAPWHSLVSTRGRKVTVLQTDFEATNGAPALADRLLKLAREVSTRASRYGQAATQNDRIDAFEKSYGEARANDHDIRPLISKYRNDYLALREHFLSHSSHGFGPRWCPSIERRAHSTHIDDATLAAFAADFIAVVRAAEQACVQFPKSIMIAAAAQAATVHVVELAALLGLPAKVVLDWSSIDLKSEEAGEPQLRIGRGAEFLVGSNPFATRGHSDFNPLHWTRIEDDIRLGPPLIGDFNEESVPKSDSLLAEDEWEASVVYLYSWAQPVVHIGDESFAATHIPPLYPWGFQLLDMRDLRSHNLNGVSKYWHLVEGFHGDGTQICKGGGLRDRNPTTFEIGSRGSLRIGEYDEFLAPAFKFK